MKPSTFANILFNHGAAFAEGYSTGANWEVQAQVAIDKILKKAVGASVASVAMGGTKIREIPYPYTGETVDFGYHLRKPAKTTEYFIELKVQSEQTKKFSGMSWKKALKQDIAKLEYAIEKRVLVNFGNYVSGAETLVDSRRYFACLIAFDPTTVGNIVGNMGTLGVAYQMVWGTTQYEGNNYNMVVVVCPITLPT